ncbi:MAG: hypothetical protein Q8Q42_04275 [Nanoarchaeota archaeon]|nr:hypothetical protein [Nanoarchaeota archaeon]
MDFKKLFEAGNLDTGLKNNLSSSGMLSLAVEGSHAWKNHIKICNVAKIISMNIGGERIEVIDETGNRLLDGNEWRIGLENKAKLMIEGQKVVEEKPKESINSENFSIRMDSELYGGHLLAAGCMCGVKIEVGDVKQKSNEYGITASSSGEVYASGESPKKGSIYSG